MADAHRMTQDDVSQNLAELTGLLNGGLAAAAPLRADLSATAATAGSWQTEVRGRSGPLRHPRIAIFCQTGTARQDQALASLQNGTAPLAAAAEAINSDLLAHEIPPAAPGDASAILHAVAYGMTAVQPGLDLLGLACPENDSPLPGAKTLDALIASGNTDIAALCGAAIAARLARVPVVGSGPAYVWVYELLLKHDAAAHMASADALIDADGADAPTHTAAAMAYLKSLAALNS